MIRAAHSIEGLPDCNGDVTIYTVGHPYRRSTYENGKFKSFETMGHVTRIIVENDLAGPHGWLEQAKVFNGDVLVFQAAVMNLGGVHY